MSLSEQALLEILRLSYGQGNIHLGERCFNIMCAQMRHQIMINEPSKYKHQCPVSFPENADVRINGRRVRPMHYSGSWAQPIPPGVGSTPEKTILLSGWAWEEDVPTVSSANQGADRGVRPGRDETVVLSHRITSMGTGIGGSDSSPLKQQSTSQTQSSQPCSHQQKAPPSRTPCAPPNVESLHHTSLSPNSVSKDARMDSNSEAGSETVAQDTQAKRPDHDTLSEQERRDRVNPSVQTALREYREERLTNPTDEELQKWGCPKLLDPRARMFICQLPDEDLRTIRRHTMPGWLAGLLSQIADEEIERRAGEDEASS